MMAPTTRRYVAGRNVVAIMTLPHIGSPLLIKFTPLITSDRTSKTKAPDLGGIHNQHQIEERIKLTEH